MFGTFWVGWVVGGGVGWFVACGGGLWVGVCGVGVVGVYVSGSSCELRWSEGLGRLLVCLVRGRGVIRHRAERVSVGVFLRVRLAGRWVVLGCSLARLCVCDSSKCHFASS